MAGFWKPVRQRALKQTFELVRLDQTGRIVLWAGLLAAAALTAPSFGEGLIRAFAVIGATALVGLGVYFVKLVSIPPKVAAEVEEAHAAKIAALRAEVTTTANDRDALRAELVELKKPPPRPSRDPDGVYQHGRHVGVVHLPQPNPASGVVVFARINGLEFNPDQQFEYRDWILKLQSMDVLTRADTSGQRGETGYHGAVCSIVGRKP
jgi:hypothetical protein